ncbi:MAG: hypothetical protein EOO87_03170 [Pedobacter sp.]|nr:MAG: hypothetical protein EOO87_03170 [Pedobacter sp.]
MKYIITTTLLVLGLFCNAQIPIIKSNVNDEFKNRSLVYKTFYNKYDLLIAYKVSGGWRVGNTNIIQILAVKNNSWKKITLSYPDDNPSKQTIKKLPLQKTEAKKLMEELGSQNFWTLNNDSINMKHLKPQTPPENYSKKDTLFIVANNPVTDVKVVDGSTYYFEIIKGDSLRSYSTADPEIFAKYFPEIKSRIRFIKCKIAFENALNQL